MKLFWTLKSKIIFSCIMTSCILVTVFGTFIYQNAKNSHIEQQIVNLTSRLNTVVGSIDQEYSQFYRLSLSLSNSKVISNFLNAGNDLANENTYQLVNTYNECTQLLVNLGIYDLFSKGILVSQNHDFTINFGLIHGHDSDYDYFLEAEPQINLSAPCNIVDNPFFYGGEDYIIPFHVPIYSYQSIHEAGCLYVALDAEIITQHFRESDIEANGNLYIIMKERIYSYNGKTITDITNQFDSLELAIVEQIDNQTYRTAAIPQLDNNEFIYVQSNGTGWAIMQQIAPYSIATAENFNTTHMILVILMVLLTCIVFYAYLNHSINKPITSLIGQLNDIADGDFYIQDNSESSAEFHRIRAEINRMASALDKLISTTLENEKQKKAYEFKLLQSQINPHFLYNTLNSIRWLGEINGINGITEITTALTSMLRSIAKVESQFVSVQTELSFIQDYATIQHYRYGNIFTIEYHLDDDILKGAKIIKFILQPLVENAIFHGIEPSGRQGNILIHISSEENTLIIRVKDNGVGISPEQVEALNRHEQDNSGKDIGLDNIHQRLILEYGESYGLTVESSFGAYTVVTLRTPLEYWETTDETRNI